VSAEGGEEVGEEGTLRGHGFCRCSLHVWLFVLGVERRVRVMVVQDVQPQVLLLTEYGTEAGEAESSDCRVTVVLHSKCLQVEYIQSRRNPPFDPRRRLRLGMLM